MEALTILAVGTLCIVCFLVGAKVGQTVSKGEPIEIPNLNPIKAIKEHQDKEEADKEAKAKQERFDTMMQNIENYNGTSIGQKEITRW